MAFLTSAKVDEARLIWTDVFIIAVQKGSWPGYGFSDKCKGR